MYKQDTQTGLLLPSDMVKSRKEEEDEVLNDIIGEGDYVRGDDD